MSVMSSGKPHQSQDLQAWSCSVVDRSRPRKNGAARDLQVRLLGLHPGVFSYGSCCRCVLVWRIHQIFINPSTPAH